MQIQKTGSSSSCEHHLIPKFKFGVLYPAFLFRMKLCDNWKIEILRHDLAAELKANFKNKLFGCIIG